ncbi:uncharacterized protein BHQ10_006035 [Talaromyces amestolkiae]|uniref:Uncharacterized protein n=1 Tax=Talaromyces amestolkiae TaxID=1196081 RepID=A0A364L2H7_TALAM|nr:uncharacterized protein BHQ10_006035 [Talaromyces amestolkiae]RAO70023.1 hypothetical protein BHQ10_006035 [Talaromyces amestolkiae]
MGGNQAMRDTVDMLPAILNLAKKSMKNTITEQDYTKEVKEYEIKMSPCAFGWVKASGGSGELVAPNLDGYKGWLTVFVISRALYLAWLYGAVLSFFGFGPKDDALELRD